MADPFLNFAVGLRDRIIPGSKAAVVSAENESSPFEKRLHNATAYSSSDIQRSGHKFDLSSFRSVPLLFLASGFSLAGAGCLDVPPFQEGVDDAKTGDVGEGEGEGEENVFDAGKLGNDEEQLSGAGEGEIVMDNEPEDQNPTVDNDEIAKFIPFGSRVKALVPSEITDGDYAESDPSIVWNGENYGLVWSRGSEGDANATMFVPLNREGRKTAEPHEINSSENNVRLPSIHWNDSNYVLGWFDVLQKEMPNDDDNATPYAAILNEHGNVIDGSIAMLGSGKTLVSKEFITSGSDSGVYAGAFALRGNSFMGTVGLEILLGMRYQGSNLEVERVVEANMQAAREPAISCNSRDCAVVWLNDVTESGSQEKHIQIRFAQALSGESTIVHQQTVKDYNRREEPYIPASVQIEAAEEGYGIMWEELSLANPDVGIEASGIYFARVTPDGDDYVIENPEGIEPDAGPLAMVWSGIEYAVAWKKENRWFFSRLDRVGRLKSDPIPVITDDWLPASFFTINGTPTVSWNKYLGEYVLIWAAQETCPIEGEGACLGVVEGRKHLYFSKIVAE